MRLFSAWAAHAPRHRLISAALFVLLCAVALALPAQPALALGPIVMQQTLSNTRDHSEIPRIALGGGRIAAVWGERNGRKLGFSATAPNAQWPRADFFSTGTLTKVQWSAVVVDGGGTVHVAYASGNSVYYRSQAPSGAWSQPLLVADSNLPNPVCLARAPDGTLWVVWRDREGTALFYRFSRDGGQSWHTGDDGGVIAAEDGNMTAPALAIDQHNGPHVVWYIRAGEHRMGEIRYADWDDSHFVAGSVTRDGALLYDADPAVVFDPQNVQHVVWRKQIARDRWTIMYAQRAPGADWQDFTTLSRVEGDAQYPPALGSDPLGNLYISYSEPTGKKTRRLMLLARLVGGDWSAFPVSDGPWDTYSAVVGGINGNDVVAHVLYQHEVTIDEGEIVYARVEAAFLPNPPAAPAPAAPPADSGNILVAAQQPAQPKPACTFVGATQHNLCASFRSYWQRFGGLPTYGYPLTEEFSENGITMQYFERARFELHPGAAPQRGDVLLGLLGSENTAARSAAGEAPFQAAPARAGCSFFAATQHNLCASFRSYWQRFGGLAIYGNPISEEFVENGVTVQYFERARFELHPGAAPQRGDVLTGRIGAEALAARVPAP